MINRKTDREIAIWQIEPNSRRSLNLDDSASGCNIPQTSSISIVWFGECVLLQGHRCRQWSPASARTHLSGQRAILWETGRWPSYCSNLISEPLGANASSLSVHSFIWFFHKSNFSEDYQQSELALSCLLKQRVSHCDLRVSVSVQGHRPLAPVQEDSKALLRIEHDHKYVISMMHDRRHGHAVSAAREISGRCSDRRSVDWF